MKMREDKDGGFTPGSRQQVASRLGKPPGFFSAIHRAEAEHDFQRRRDQRALPRPLRSDH